MLLSSTADSTRGMLCAGIRPPRPGLHCSAVAISETIQAAGTFPRQCSRMKWAALTSAWKASKNAQSGEERGCCSARRSLENAGVTADDVNYVNAHATSTPAGDMAEYRAIRAAIPSNHVRINGTKSMIGHLLGAAGAVEAVATVQAIRTGTG